MTWRDGVVFDFVMRKSHDGQLYLESVTWLVPLPGVEIHLADVAVPWWLLDAAPRLVGLHPDAVPWPVQFTMFVQTLT